VQRARELEDEADGERIRRLEGELGRRAEQVVAQGALWADDGTTAIIYASIGSSPSASRRITTSAELMVTRPVKRTTLATRLLSAQLAARG
jgi:hypothetical protein